MESSFTLLNCEDLSKTAQWPATHIFNVTEFYGHLNHQMKGPWELCHSVLSKICIWLFSHKREELECSMWHPWWFPMSHPAPCNRADSGVLHPAISHANEHYKETASPKPAYIIILSSLLKSHQKGNHLSPALSLINWKRKVGEKILSL